MAEVQSQVQASSLEKLARARFSTLSVAELKLVRAAPESGGGMAYCGASHRNDDPDNDPSRASGKQHEWGPDRQIRAELIRWICVDRRARDCVDPVGVQIHAAKVVGELSLAHIAVPFPLHLRLCFLADDASLYATEIPLLDLSGSWIRSLNAEAVNVRGNIQLRDSFHADGEVRLTNAQIGGNLECSGTFINPARSSGSGIALDADAITVKGSVFLRDGFHAEGEVRFPAGQIGGNLECIGAALINPPGK